MGGLSSGKVNIEEVKNKKCYRMIGNVTTKNNGGFIQIRVVLDKWSEIKLPFTQFKKSNFYQPKQFSYQKIKSICIVAGFENYKPDLAVSEIGFY